MNLDKFNQRFEQFVDWAGGHLALIAITIFVLLLIIGR